MKKIVLLTGSSHEHGTTAQLADAFQRGATAAGHQVFRFNAGAGTANMIHYLKVDDQNLPIHDDDLLTKVVLPQILDADIIAFVTPVYFFGMTAQLKTVVDRLYTDNHRLDNKECLLIAAANNDQTVFNSLELEYRGIANYFSWHSLGTLYAANVFLPKALADWPAKAEALGRQIQG
ncbi:flavodoxin family protein [Lacticaseibacillus baoqingensis]|uniref:Flavodoxin family protein n=1 Tax=Lacticaseibacillus baoqingensis TaxID=2486013 RepID=A0ABW4EA98_9LACO|nr:flavodoxin family protein [Lacticaseibacillus baoqingensis]